MPDAHPPPGPPRFTSALGAIVASRNRLALLQGLTRRYGDVVSFHAGATTYAILNHPDYVRDVLVTRARLFHKGLGLERARTLLGHGLLTSEDDLHLRQRRLLQRAFHRGTIAGYAATMSGYTERRSETWTPGAVLDVSEEMAALTLAVAGKTLFDADVEGDAAEIGAAVTAAMKAFNIALLPYGQYLAKLPIPPAIRFRRAKRLLDGIVYRLIAERRARAAPQEGAADVLTLLVAARDDDGDGLGMTDEQIRDEVMTLLLAGHETTANLMTWTLYLLSQHPRAEAAVQQEADAVAGSRLPEASDIPRLPFARAVIAEAMRLYPPAYLVGRRAMQPYAVPGTAYVLPARTVVLMSQYLLHRDARFWPEPEQFNPDRWLQNGAFDEPGLASATRRAIYFPFGAGPRVCIGEHFAWMEATLMLVTLARRWRFRLVPGHPVDTQPIMTLRPRYGMKMVVERRTSA